ncbi:ATP-binding cassette domain-containing protein [Streptomyces sp. OF3]|uniref:ATP-binding cassette domain-containing protein n=1 Tax=Streptomyces alkaliterrae TaxID=2213162 RepID=A0A7W3WH69_9ACTN|nr:ATP-binding cassette domain-containing protein [Streptomyces alkaliterrae]MBB1252331.1 ATP-binding cassette domain-containing protein [Streptomyces alkaliterrae]
MSAKVAPPDNDVLWARGLDCAHQGSPALTGVSIAVRDSEVLVVAGARGSGKTTLLRCLSGRLRPDAGEVWFNSVPLHVLAPRARDRLRRDRFGWVGSTPELVPELAAWENAALPLLLSGVSGRTARRTALEWLERLDVGDCASRRPAALLQSERQRVAIARSLVHRPTVLFADEPTAPLHRHERTAVLRTLTTAARSHGITVILTAQEPLGLPRPAGTAAPADRRPPEIPVADRVLTLVDGRLTAGSSLSAGPRDTTPCSLSA